MRDYVDKDLVLRETSKGRKRKLSMYRSKRKNKKEHKTQTSKVSTDHNFIHIQDNENSDIEIDVELLSDAEKTSVNNEEEFFNIEDEVGYHEGRDIRKKSTIEKLQLFRKENTAGQDEYYTDEKYIDYCIDKIIGSGMLRSLLWKLCSNRMLPDFMRLMETLNNGRLPLNNIAWILVLERARFASCDTTVGMRYNKVTKNFWSIVYRLCKGSGLKFFSGEKNWGQLVRKVSKKSRYDPLQAKVNFAIPDEKILRLMNSNFPKYMEPGIIQNSLELLKNKKDIVLMADGKLVGKGLKENFKGDVNLFGHEDNPNLDNLKSEFLDHIEDIANSIAKYDTTNKQEQFHTLAELVKLLTNLNIKIRAFHWKQNNKLHKLSGISNQGRNFERNISRLKTDLYTSAIWMKKSLNCNVNLMNLMAVLQTNTHTFNSTGPIEINSTNNIRLLYDSAYVQENLDTFEFPHLIKQQSDVWEDLVRQSILTDANVFMSVGLATGKVMKNLFRRNIINGDAVHNYTWDNIDCVTDGISTLSSLILPAFYASCCVFYEEGCRYIRGKFTDKLIACCSTGVIRFHHNTSTERLQCSRNVSSDHENMCVLILERNDFNSGERTMYTLNDEEIVRILCCMKSTEMYKCLALLCGSTSVSCLECSFSQDIWKHISSLLRKSYDKIHPTMPELNKERKFALLSSINEFRLHNTSLICEVPRNKGIITNVVMPEKFSAYHMSKDMCRKMNDSILESAFDEICMDLSKLVEEGFNFLRVEASEILAFLCTDSHRISRPGIPDHIPIAYGLKSASMTSVVMRNIVEDIRNKLKNNNTSVLCEVYDGQHHNLIVRSIDQEPLTRIQHAKDHFNNVMRNFNKSELIRNILKFSTVCESDLEQISSTTFNNNKTLQLNSVSVQMKRIVDGHTMKRSMFITTNEIDCYKMSDIVTHHRSQIWNRYLKQISKRKHKVSNTVQSSSQLTSDEIAKLIKGTRFHRRITRRIEPDAVSPNSDSEEDDEELDPTYNPNQNINEVSSSSDDLSSEDLEMQSIANISTTSIVSMSSSCIDLILEELQKLNNRHRWNSETSDSLIQKYLTSNEGINKLFLYEMDIINSKVEEQFQKRLFDKKDNKQTRVRKICEQLNRLPEIFQISEPILEAVTTFSPKTLFELCHSFIVNSPYPKEYVAAPYAEITYLESVYAWEAKSPISIHLNVTSINTVHTIFNYPEVSKSRKQLEFRTFDYTHILNNIRYHICNKGIDNVSYEAFIRVSDTNHDVLPRAIVEDKMDRQNCLISQRFFSEEVQEILTENGDLSEAKFVKLIRNWFRACDERGLTVTERLKFWNEMYYYLVNQSALADFPPKTTHIAGIPILTFEAILHCTSTRFSLYHQAEKNMYNTRSISTLAIESFFSDLSRFEFSGSGNPKAVDIPKLVSHVVHINSTKHDPERGFEFTTSTRDNYPVHVMSESEFGEDDGNESNSARNHPFDYPIHNARKKKRKDFVISKPKHVTKGGQGIRQFLKVDESKLSAEQRLGRKLKESDWKI